MGNEIGIPYSSFAFSPNMDMIGMFSIHDTQMTLEKYQTLEDEHSQKEDDSNSFENDDLLEK
jgi:hypothetical protein